VIERTTREIFRSLKQQQTIYGVRGLSQLMGVGNGFKKEKDTKAAEIPNQISTRFFTFL